LLHKHAWCPHISLPRSPTILCTHAGATGGESPEQDAHYFDALPPRPRQAAADQWAWIEAQLAASTAQYIFVGGHYSL
jgi:hypothetical protein